jgi:3-oxoacyl-[acyl-carrier protein] reductase
MLFAEHGAAVVINDIDADVAQATAGEINKAGGRAAACAGSVTFVPNNRRKDAEPK